MSLLPIGLATLAVIGVILFARPRRFYFIRHGETILNQQHVRQGENGDLSENGLRQAEKLGSSLEGLQIGRIISSPYPRARQTSEIINKHLLGQVIYLPLLAERRNSSEIIGKSTHDPAVMSIVDKIDNAYHDDNYRFSDEENFIDLKERARKCINLLALQGAQNTVVVTHHAFLKMLLAYILHRENLHAGDYAKLSFFNQSDNAGISVCEFHPLNIFSPTRGWEVVSYNQQP